MFQESQVIGLVLAWWMNQHVGSHVLGGRPGTG